MFTVYKVNAIKNIVIILNNIPNSKNKAIVKKQTFNFLIIHKYS